MGPTITGSALIYQATSRGTASREDMRAAWNTVYKGCRRNLHDIFDPIKEQVRSNLRSGVLVVTGVAAGDTLDDLYPSIPDNVAVVAFLGKTDEDRADQVMGNEPTLQVMADWLVPADFILGYDVAHGAIVVYAPS
jgi:hypothetical protein